MIGSKKLRVLVVDDTIVYRKAISDIIEEIPGVELAGVAHNGKIALSKIRTLKPDILTLDIEMPQMDGLTLCKKVKEELGLKQMDVIMFSSLINDQMIVKCKEVGATGYITKPEINKLATILDSIWQGQTEGT